MSKPNALERLEPVLVLALIAALFLPGIDKITFHPDESHWIGLSGAFEDFVGGRWDDATWLGRKSGLLNPTVTYYIVGMSRALHDLPASQLEPIWVFGETEQQNVAAGRVPSDRMLQASRLGVTTAAVLGIWLIFLVARRAVHPAAVYVWLGFALFHPFLRVYLRRAANEGGLLLMVAGAIWAGSHALAAHGTEGSPARWRFFAWLGLAGLFSGLAAQTKANGGVVVLGVLLAAGLPVLRQQAVSFRRRVARYGLVAVTLVSTSLLGFVGTNPVFWRDTPQRMASMIDARVATMSHQLRRNRKLIEMPGPERARYVADRVLEGLSPLPDFVPGKLVFLAGLAASLVSLFARPRRENHALVVLLLAGGMVSIPPLFTPLDWPRYYLLPVFFAGLISVVGLGLIAEGLWRTLARLRLQGLP